AGAGARSPAVADELVVALPAATMRWNGRCSATLHERKSVENLKVYQKAVTGADAILAITSKPAFDGDRELRQQLRTASGRIQAHLQEGSAQSTDKHKAHYISIALGSAKEVKGHLRRALGYGFITEDEYGSNGTSTMKSPRC